MAKDYFAELEDMDLSESTYTEPDYKEEGMKNMVSLVRSAFADKGIFHMQFNTCDKDTLIDAQKHPEQYPTLIVRVAGYSVYFNDLKKDVQDHVIDRMEHRF